MPTPTQVLQSQVEELTQKIKELEHKLAVPLKEIPVVEAVRLPEAFIQEYGESDPIPSTWRETVDTILNKDFGIHVKGSPELPQFTFTVIVPEKYSTFTPEQKAMHHVDLRPRVIENALGASGVKEWVEQVYKSFDSDRQAIITNDRLSTQA